jgi:hypothetical protein
MNQQSEILHEILRSHLDLGDKKAVSYLPIQTIENVLRLSVEQYLAKAKDRGLSFQVFSPVETCIESGAVYLYDRQQLDGILAANRNILLEGGWPADSKAFVVKVATTWLDKDDKILPVVKAAFGENKD